MWCYVWSHDHLKIYYNLIILFVVNLIFKLCVHHTDGHYYINVQNYKITYKQTIYMP